MVTGDFTAPGSFLSSRLLEHLCELRPPGRSDTCKLPQSQAAILIPRSQPTMAPADFPGTRFLTGSHECRLPAHPSTRQLLLSRRLLWPHFPRWCQKSRLQQGTCDHRYPAGPGPRHLTQPSTRTLKDSSKEERTPLNQSYEASITLNPKP